MEVQVLPIHVPPGFLRNGTTYQAKGRWVDGNLVRFFQGTVRPVGGWQRVLAADGTNLAAVSGMPRACIAWRSNASDLWLGVGTVTKLYILSGQTWFDVTPSGFPGTGHTDSVDSSSTYGSGAYSGGLYGTGAAVGTLEDADVWSLDNFGEFLVGVSTVDEKLYVWAGDTSVIANVPKLSLVWTGSLVVDGAVSPGATSISLKATTLTGSISAGQTFIVGGVTYTAQAAAVAAANIITISTNEVLVSIADGAAVSGTDTQAPSAEAVVVTPERFVTLLAADGDARQVWWADQERTDVWQAVAANLAGSFILTTNGRLMCGKRTRSETLLWTDADLWRMTFIGAPLVYGFAQAGDQCGIISRRAAVVIDAGAFWMGRSSFYGYNGYVQRLPCDVADYVFGNLNTQQAAKIWALSSPTFGEVTWFYPSLASTELDSYVTYNYAENHWTTGSLVRTAGAPASVLPTPFMLDASGVLWQHETGTDHGGAAPFLLSGPIEIGPGDLQGFGRAGQGEQVVKLQYFIPDERTLGDLQMSVLGQMFPTDTPKMYGPFAAAAPTSVRITARQFQLRFDEHVANDWRLGLPRIGIRLGGKR